MADNDNKIVTYKALKKYTQEMGERVAIQNNNIYRHVLSVRFGTDSSKILITIDSSSGAYMSIEEIEKYIKDNFSFSDASAQGNMYGLIANGYAGAGSSSVKPVCSVYYSTDTNKFSLLLENTGALPTVYAQPDVLSKMQEIIIPIAIVNQNPNTWSEDTPYTSSPKDTDTIDNVNLTNAKVKKITFANLFTWISNKLASLLDAKADKATTLSGYGITNAYTKTETNNLLNAKLNLSGGTMTGAITTKTSTGIKRDVDNEQLGIYGGSAYNKGAYLQLAGKDNSSIAGGFTLCATNGTTNKYFQGKPDGSLKWDSKNILVAKSTNGTLTKSSVITNDYSHYIKNENIYQLSIGFQCNSDIAKDAILYTLPETISSASIEMYIVISTVAGDTRILQCGGGGGGTAGNVLKAKSIIPAGYWFGSAIFIKL